MEIRTALYRLYGGEDTLLYVGISARPRLRIERHRRTTSWGCLINRTDIEWYETRQSALRAETGAIMAEAPLHNIAKNQARNYRAATTLPVRLNLVGAAEIGAILGVSRQRVHQLTTSKGFPDPVAELVSATIWLEADIRAWVKRTGRKAAA